MKLFGENEIRYATQLAFWADTIIIGTEFFSVLLFSLGFFSIFLTRKAACLFFG